MNITAWDILEVAAIFAHQHLMELLAYVRWVRYWQRINMCALKSTASVMNGSNVKAVVFPPSIDAMELAIVLLAKMSCNAAIRQQK